MHLTLRTRINLALGVGLLLVLTFGVAAYVTIDAFLRDSREERASQEGLLLLERTVLQLKTAESWQRKFIITADAEDLKAYQAATVHVTHALQRLRGSAALHDPERRMVELADTIERRLQSMEASVRIRQQEGLGAAAARVASDLNRQLRESIDRLAEQIKAGEQAALQGARAQTEAAAQLVKRLIGAAGVVAAGVLAWAIFLVNVYALRRRRAEAGLAASVAQLERVGSALRASEAQLREVLDTVPVLFSYIDAQQRVQFHNRAYEESLGRRRGDIQGRALREVLGPTLYEASRAHIERAFQGHVVTYERTQRHADGTLHDHEMKYFPRFGEGEQAGQVVGVYAMGSDITEFKRIDRMKSEFVATVSHELRTPLTSIRGSLGLIAGGLAGPLPDKAKELVLLARDSCERLVRLVNDILDVEKLEAGQLALQLRPARLEPLLQRVLSDHGAFAAQHEVTMSLETPDADAAAGVDADRFIQVVTNLLSNAVRFSPRGGAVTVRLLRTGDDVRVEVCDHGPGIPPEFRSRIFGKFSQADSSNTRQKSGSGLGLSIAKSLIERMGGRIGYSSSADGTTFFVELPASVEEEER